MFVSAGKEEIFISWERFAQDARALSQKIVATCKAFDRILCVSRGGLNPAAFVARELELRHVDTICLESYADAARSGEAVRLLKSPAPEFLSGAETGRGILVIDDLTDTGKTAEFVRRRYPDCFIACLYAKPQGEAAADCFITSFPQESWLVFPWET